MNIYYQFIAKAEKELWPLSEGEIVDLLLDNFYEFKSSDEARPIAKAYIKEFRNETAI